MENILKIIEVIGKQWPFLIVLFVITVFIIKWNSIWALVESITHIKIKRGQTEIEFEKDSETKIVEKESKLENPKIGTEDNLTESCEEKEENDFSKYQNLLKERKFSDAKSIFEKILEKDSDDSVRKKHLISNFYWRHIHGDIKAFDEFEEYITKIEADNELKSLIKSTLSFFYKDSMNIQKAIDLLFEAIGLTSDVEDKAVYVTRISNLYYESGDKQKALEILQEYLIQFTDRKTKIQLFQTLASYYEKEKNKLFEALAYQKALECQPNNITLLFYSAYNYSMVQDRFNDIGLLLYIKLLDINPKHESALNNLGVSYKNLELPFKSVEFYKKAVEANSTIAASNLAYLLMDAGFEKEAEEYLKNAIQNENVHDNVYSANSNLKVRLNNEKEKEEQIKIKADRKFRFLELYGDAAFAYEKIILDDSKKWKDKDIEVKIEFTDEKFSFYWEKGEEKHNISGVRHSNSLELIYYKPKRKYYSYSPDDKYEYTKHEGYGLIANENSIRCLFEIEKELVEYCFTPANQDYQS